MNHFQFECKIQLSEDGKTLMFHNKKMTTVPTYHYEQTPQDILREKEEKKLAKLLGQEYVEPEKPDEFTYELS